MLHVNTSVGRFWSDPVHSERNFIPNEKVVFVDHYSEQRHKSKSKRHNRDISGPCKRFIWNFRSAKVNFSLEIFARVNTAGDGGAVNRLGGGSVEEDEQLLWQEAFWASAQPPSRQTSGPPTLRQYVSETVLFFIAHFRGEQILLMHFSQQGLWLLWRSSTDRKCGWHYFCFCASTSIWVSIIAQ